MARLYANNFSTTLNGAITDVATTMTLTSVTGFPAVGSGDTAQVTITDGTNTEVVTATAISGSIVTITRGQEGTSGTAFADGDTVEIRVTALAFTDSLGADESPQLQAALDMNSNYISFGGSSTSTAYNVSDSGGIPRLQGPANFRYTFTSSALYMQAGTTWNRLEVTNDANRFRFYTNNSERFQIDDSGVNVSNGDLVVNTGDLEVTTGDITVSSATSIQDTSGSEILDLASNGASAVNHVQITNNTTGNAPSITSTGSDSAVDLILDAKGTASVKVTAPLEVSSDVSVSTGNLQVFSSSGGGTTGTVAPISITVGDTSTGGAWPGDGTLSTCYNYFSGDSSNNGVRFRHGVGETTNSGTTSIWKLQYRSSGGSISTYTGFSDAITVTSAGDVTIASRFFQNTDTGITASATQSQGEQLLTGMINEISTVTTTNDVVTLPAAVAGLSILVINNGSNTLQIYPFSGDNLGNGNNNSTTLAAGNNKRFTTYDATNWVQET